MRIQSKHFKYPELARMWPPPAVHQNTALNASSVPAMDNMKTSHNKASKASFQEGIHTYIPAQLITAVCVAVISPDFE